MYTKQPIRVLWLIMEEGKAIFIVGDIRLWANLTGLCPGGEIGSLVGFPKTWVLRQRFEWTMLVGEATSENLLEEWKSGVGKGRQ
jgi:hypothetical protein